MANIESNKTVLIQQLRAQHIRSERVLDAIAQVPREHFVPAGWEQDAYLNRPLPIGHEQTISQPYVVARMTELLLAMPAKKILEIGTGSGYQAAVLAKLVDEVYSVERILPLLEQAREKFKLLDINNIHTLYGDGHLGWPEHAPYDAILVTAATPAVPPALYNQLAENGRLLLPVGEIGKSQTLQLITRHGKTFKTEIFDSVIFVPLLEGKTTE